MDRNGQRIYSPGTNRLGCHPTVRFTRFTDAHACLPSDRLGTPHMPLVRFYAVHVKGLYQPHEKREWVEKRDEKSASAWTLHPSI